MDSNSRLATVEEAAEQLNVKPGTIYDWTYRGVLPHVRIQAGSRRAVIRFRPSDLERFIAERSVEERRSSRTAAGS